MCLYGGPDLVLRLLQVDLDPLRLGAVKVRVDEELDAVALGVPAMQRYFKISGLFLGSVPSFTYVTHTGRPICSWISLFGKGDWADGKNLYKIKPNTGQRAGQTPCTLRIKIMSPS